jgi:hypothetical protein
MIWSIYMSNHADLKQKCKQRYFTHGCTCWIGQSRRNTPYMTIYWVISPPKIHRICMVLANPMYLWNDSSIWPSLYTWNPALCTWNPPSGQPYVPVKRFLHLVHKQSSPHKTWLSCSWMSPCQRDLKPLLGPAINHAGQAGHSVKARQSAKARQSVTQAISSNQ